MRWSEFVNKECVDLVNGEKLGKFSHADLSFHPQTGKVESIHIPVRTSLFNRHTHELTLSWKMIKKIGPEMVIVDTALHKE